MKSKVSAEIHLVAFTPVNVWPPCEACCIEHVCGLDLHSHIEVGAAYARQHSRSKSCISAIPHNHCSRPDAMPSGGASSSHSNIWRICNTDR